MTTYLGRMSLFEKYWSWPGMSIVDHNVIINVIIVVTMDFAAV